MKRIKIAYRTFWNAVDPLDGEYFLRMFPALRGDYEIVTSRDPDYVIHSVYGYVDPKEFPSACKILISCEGGGDHFAEGGKLGPGEYDPDYFHWGLTCWWGNLHPRHIYLPPPLINVNLYNGGVQRVLLDRTGPYPKHKFCNFIYSNPYSMDRRMFKDKLAQYKPVDCPGPVDTNITPIHFTGYNAESYLIKQACQVVYKFSIAFENCYTPGYTTEKLTDPMIARSVPIYRGNPCVKEILNPASFINWDDYGYDEGLIEYIKAVDSDEQLYKNYLNEPPIRSREFHYWDDNRYLQFFRGMFG